LGKILRKKAYLIIGCLVLTAAMVALASPGDPLPKAQPLQNALSNIDGWQLARNFPLDAEVTGELKLDDYVNMRFTKQDREVLLYIGYYNTAAKVGAAHDPMVCFPGQGWTVSRTGVKPDVNLDSRAFPHSTMVVRRGTYEELIVYWFQAYDQRYPDTFTQKLATVWNRIRGRGADSAFVRFSTPLNDRSLEESYGVIMGFIHDFYPVFLAYVKQG
jgi:EpsI family protein